METIVLHKKKLVFPKLRFKGFADTWHEKRLGEIFKINAGGDIDDSHVSPIQTDKYKYPIYANAEKNKGFYAYSDIYKVEAGTITIAGRGVNIGIAHARDHRFYPIVRLLVLTPLNNENINFGEYAINRINLFPESTGVPQLTVPQVSGYTIGIPTLSEQQKIASFLSELDKKIHQLTRKKELLEQYKKGVMQQLFSGKLRFKDEKGKAFPKWEEKRLSCYLQVSKTKNKNLEYSKADVLSVSGEYGIVNQIEFQGRSFAGASVHNYGVVENGDIVYTKSPLKSNPYGIIKVNRGKAGIVSTLYAVYKCKNNVSGEYLDFYFQLDFNLNSYLRPLVQKGSKNDMKINNDKVLIDPVYFPSKSEQLKIVKYLNAADLKIKNLHKQITQTKNFKKGLLQQMFV